MKTEFPSKSEIVRTWFVIDASEAALGRVASKAAKILMGKHKPIYTPFLDTGDHVIVINAEKAVLTGNKINQKVYRAHSGYPGGLHEVSAVRVKQVRPVRMVEEAVRGMLPKTKLGKQMYRKLKVYAGEKHPHAAQQPKALAVAGS
jgi:large subunit ribosomal protein L13